MKKRRKVKVDRGRSKKGLSNCEEKSKKKSKRERNKRKRSRKEERMRSEEE